MPCKVTVKGVTAILAMAGLLMFGGVSTIASNDIFTTTTTNMPGNEGNVQEFVWPLFFNFWMFAGMALSCFAWIYEHVRAKKKAAASRAAEETAATSSILGESENGSAQGGANEEAEGHEVEAEVLAPPRRTCWQRYIHNPWGALLFSSLCDLAGSSMDSIGLSPLCNVPVSVYQMLMGSIMIFTPVLAFFFLKQRPTRQQFMAVGLCIIGICAVGLSSWLASVLYPAPDPEDPGDPTDPTDPVDPIAVAIAEAPTWMKFFLKPTQLVDYSSLGSSSTGMLILGLFLIIIAQLIYAGQFVLEEFTMKEINCYATQVVGIEGICGLLITVFIVFPFTYFTGIENDYDAFKFMAAEPSVILPVMLFFICATFYNMFGQTITKLISASHRTIIEALRGLVVWIFALIERAIFGDPWGESLQGWASFLEAVGFVITFVGALFYYEVVRIKGTWWSAPCTCRRRAGDEERLLAGEQGGVADAEDDPSSDL